MSAGDDPMQETDRELLIRLDERVRSAVTTMEQRDIYHRQEMDRLTKLMVDQTAAGNAMIVGFYPSTDPATREAAPAERMRGHIDIQKIEMWLPE